ncbi:taste receptor type 2 member 40-like [Pseudophryne corroboree]|uniref:taste receptor type 2 member 40-like n=1 Tax=Pseudophryne corroboree TaxID=495146 RepID=UPI003081B477
MVSAVILTKFIITLITGISGTIAGCSVFHVYIKHRRETSNLGVCDKIQLVTVLTNLLLQGVMTVHGSFEYFGVYLMLENNMLLLLMFTAQHVLIVVSFWNTAWLSIFYSVSLVNVSHQFLHRNKARFISSVPQLVMGSLLWSIVSNIPTFFTATVENVRNNTDDPFGYIILWNSYDVIIGSLIRFFIPFSMTCLGIGVSVRSILRHIWRMTQEDSHLTSAQLQGHVRAVRSLVVRFILDILFFFTTTIITVLSPLNYID